MIADEQRWNSNKTNERIKDEWIKNWTERKKKRLPTLNLKFKLKTEARATV